MNAPSVGNEFAVADTTKAVKVRKGYRKQRICILQGIKSRRNYKYHCKKTKFFPKPPIQE